MAPLTVLSPFNEAQNNLLPGLVLQTVFMLMVPAHLSFYS